MDGNGNQWQQNNDARIEDIKQQIATLNRQLSSTNLSEAGRTTLRNQIRQQEDALQTLRYGNAMRGCALAKDLYGKPRKPY